MTARMSFLSLVSASLDTGSLILTSSLLSHWLCHFFFSGGVADTLACLVISLPHHPDSSTCLLAAITARLTGWTGSDGSLQLLVKWSRAPPAAGGAATTGKDAVTLRAPVRFWRNSVFLSLVSSPACVCVSVLLHTYLSRSLCMLASHVCAFIP